MIDVGLLASSAWTVLQPYLPVLATKAVEEIGKKVPDAVSTVWEAIKRKFEGKPASQEAMDDLLKAPEDTDTQAAFRQQLKKTLAQDQSFAADLSRLLEAAASSYQASVKGGGAIAQGPGTKAVGQGGVMVDGDVSGNIVTGNHNKIDSDKK